MVGVLAGFEISAVKVLIPPPHTRFLDLKKRFPGFSLLSCLSLCLTFKNLRSSQVCCWRILVRLDRNHGLLLKVGSTYCIDK